MFHVDGNMASVNHIFVALLWQLMFQLIIKRIRRIFFGRKFYTNSINTNVKKKLNGKCHLQFHCNGCH